MTIEINYKLMGVKSLAKEILTPSDGEMFVSLSPQHLPKHERAKNTKYSIKFLSDDSIEVFKHSPIPNSENVRKKDKIGLLQKEEINNVKISSETVKINGKNTHIVKGKISWRETE